ncbi:FadR/GntR family transcriptional regulator [Pseudonocardia sp. MH-G8]|uniref:FadR/GntR family transcriptional regulator n=1 Tax=Pseudonocardia sp. MH-G8 TaxID=1854588 RepID=UPI000BA1580D|nr:FCD domain-containing protein [Pseudonocardia sp. MH-G8]OZM83464.1 GntR family transcriptional regulator [Pseudonocardia sp. MH-G8]
MRPGRADVVAEDLLQLILDGTFPVGGALPSESDLAGRFGVSRLTVREAIRSLVHTRVLDVQQGRSTLVNPTDRWSPLDGRLLLARSRSGGDPLLLPRRLLEARRAVEVAIVELAAARRQESHLERLHTLHEQMLDGHARGDAVATAEADLAFHAALFDAADNVFLDALFEPLAGVLRAMRQETSAVPDFRSHALDRHAAILRAVEAGNPAAARAAMEAHLQQTEDDVERYLGTAAGTPAVTRS